MKKISIRQDNGEVRVLGSFDPSARVLFVKRKRSKHFFNKLSAWGIDEKAFTSLVKEHGLLEIVLTDTENKKRYVASVEDFVEYGKHLHFSPYRLQVFLPEKYWREL